MFKPKRKKYTTEEINAIENRAYIRGYKMGYATAERDTLFRKNTPNEIREILGLPKIEEVVK